MKLYLVHFINAWLHPFYREKVLDSDTITRLVNILKTPCPNLQKMAASILDYLATTETYVVMITAAGIESGLNAVFHQKFLDGMVVVLFLLFIFLTSDLFKICVPLFYNF